MTNPQDPSQDRSAGLDLLRLADQCVKCGYCLAVCPTYAKTRHEAESPRGRIALIQGWLSGQLEFGPQLAAHLDRCLLCRACEPACPSSVAYGSLMDGARAHRFAALPPWRRLAKRLWLNLLANARLMQAIASLARFYSLLIRFIGLTPEPRVAKGLPGPLGLNGIPISRLGLQLEAIYRLFKTLGQTARPIRPRPPEPADIELFVGCTGASIQGRAIAATLMVCERLKVRVRIPEGSPCCGALYRHEGLKEAAEHALQGCARSYSGHTLVGLASACIAELRADPRFDQVWELCAYLDRLTWPEGLRLAPLPARVLVHEPCSHRYPLGGNAAVWRLLGRIPALELLGFPEEMRCCGAAGTYLLREPQMSRALRDDHIAYIQRLKPAFVLTTNPGCALHLLAGIEETGLKIDVCHPIELIARQLADPTERSP